MQLFSVAPKIHLLDTFRIFVEEFQVGAGDMVLTETVLFERYMRKLTLGAKVVLKDSYDTGEPNDEAVDRILKDIRGDQIKRIIAVGGGSVIDIAKVLMIKDAYPITRVLDGTIAPIPGKQLIVLPTTCGTGSEVTSGGIITVKKTGLKTAIIDERLTATHAVLVPQLIEALPQNVFMNCSVDALGHAIESFLSATRGNELARAVATRAVELILDGYSDLLKDGEQAKEQHLANFLMASCLAGMAVNNGGAGPVHALAYPLGETYKMGHGESIYQFLVPVLTLYRRERPGGLLERLESILSAGLQKVGYPDGGDVFAQLQDMLERLCPLRPLHMAGMTERDILPFANSIMLSKQRLLVASYIPFTEEHAVEIYRQRL